MTTPDERYIAIKHGRRLLEDLMDPGKTPRVPSIVRDRARGVLRHFPNEWELEAIARTLPNNDNRPWTTYHTGIDKEGK